MKRYQNWTPKYVHLLAKHLTWREEKAPFIDLRTGLCVLDDPDEHLAALAGVSPDSCVPEVYERQVLGKLGLIVVETS